MKIVFDSFSKISSEISKDNCLHYASQMLQPLYKVSEGFAGKVIPGELSTLYYILNLVFPPIFFLVRCYCSYHVDMNWSCSNFHL